MNSLGFDKAEKDTKIKVSKNNVIVSNQSSPTSNHKTSTQNIPNAKTSIKSSKKTTVQKRLKKLKILNNL